MPPFYTDSIYHAIGQSQEKSDSPVTFSFYYIGTLNLTPMGDFPRQIFCIILFQCLKK